MDPIKSYFNALHKHAPVEEEQEIALAIAAKESKEGMDAFIQANLRLVIYVAKEYSGRGVAWEDLIQEGNVGLVVAAQRFDHTRETRFITYAKFWIKRYIFKAFASLKKHSVCTSENDNVLDNGAEVGNLGYSTYEEDVELRHSLETVLSRLVNTGILKQRYVDIFYKRIVEERSIRDIAEEMGVSFQRIQQVEKMVLDKLERSKELQAGHLS